MASFRKTESESRRLSGRFANAGPLAGSPFSQAQILQLMKTEFARARRYGFAVACMLLQVDRLEGLVDLHGSALRDAVRRELTKLCAEQSRDSDHLGLASDDRYLIVMPHSDAEAGRRLGERLRSAFGDLEISVGGSELALQLSIGVVSSEGQESLFFETLLTQVEAALEEAMDAGGDQVCVFQDGPRLVEDEDPALRKDDA